MRKQRGFRRFAWATAVLSALAAPFLGAAAPAPTDVASPDELPPLPEGERLPPPEPLQPTVSLEETTEHLQRTAGITPGRYRGLLLELSRQYQVDPLLIAAIVTVESRWDHTAIGGHGEIGLMQILPSTGEFLARWLDRAEYDLADPLTNLEFGISYLAALTREYGSTAMALAAYNGGPRAAHRGEDHPYTQRVMRVYEKAMEQYQAPVVRPAPLPVLAPSGKMRQSA